MSSSPGAAALDLATLWDFEHPQASEQRLRSALDSARGDDALILRTQIARSQGLQGRFEEARLTLAAMEPELTTAGPEARTRYDLEWGRTHVSAAHPASALDDDARATARAAYGRAMASAHAAGLDDLEIDALHMMAFVDTDLAGQLAWNRQALAIAERSRQPAARKWEGALRNNIGYALHQAGQREEALAEFKRALAVREREGNAGATRVARWMVAWTLRTLGHDEEALAMQLQLERDNDAAGTPDVYVYEELALLYAARQDAHRAAHYEALKARAGS